MKAELFIHPSTGAFILELDFLGFSVCSSYISPYKNGQRVEFEWVAYNSFRRLHSSQEIIFKDMGFKILPSKNPAGAYNCVADEFRLTERIANQIFPNANANTNTNISGSLLTVEIYDKSYVASAASGHRPPNLYGIAPGTPWPSTQGAPLNIPGINQVSSVPIDIFRDEVTEKIECECGYAKHKWASGHANWCKMLAMGRYA